MLAIAQRWLGLSQSAPKPLPITRIEPRRPNPGLHGDLPSLPRKKTTPAEQIAEIRAYHDALEPSVPPGGDLAAVLSDLRVIVGGER